MLGKPLKGCSWQISEGPHSLDHIPIALTRCPHGVFCSEGFHAQMKLVTYGVTIESEPKSVF